MSWSASVLAPLTPYVVLGGKQFKLSILSCYTNKLRLLEGPGCAVQIEGRPREGYYEYLQTLIGGNFGFIIPECFFNVTFYYFSVVPGSVCLSGCSWRRFVILIVLKHSKNIIFRKEKVAGVKNEKCWKTISIRFVI